MKHTEYINEVESSYNKDRVAFFEFKGEDFSNDTITVTCEETLEHMCRVWSLNSSEVKNVKVYLPPLKQEYRRSIKDNTAIAVINFKDKYAGEYSAIGRRYNKQGYLKLW